MARERSAERPASAAANRPRPPSPATALSPAPCRPDGPSALERPPSPTHVLHTLPQHCLELGALLELERVRSARLAHALALALQQPLQAIDHVLVPLHLRGGARTSSFYEVL